MNLLIDDFFSKIVVEEETLILPLIKPLLIKLLPLVELLIIF